VRAIGRRLNKLFTYSIPEKRDYGRCVDVGAMYVVLCTEVIALQCREMR
jgi:hypothetical protein